MAVQGETEHFVKFRICVELKWRRQLLNSFSRQSLFNLFSFLSECFYPLSNKIIQVKCFRIIFLFLIGTVVEHQVTQYILNLD